MTAPRLSAPVLASLALFGIVSLLVLSGVTQATDIAVLQATAALRTPAMISAMQLMSTIGSWQFEAPFVAMVALLLWRRGHGNRGLRFVLFGAVGEIFYILTKLLLHRPRPAVVSHLSGAGGYSFPSGHAMLAPILWGVGLWLVGNESESRVVRVACSTLAVLIALGIAISRVYLGVHYPTDVIGGLALGMAWSFYWIRRVRDAADDQQR